MILNFRCGQNYENYPTLAIVNLIFLIPRHGFLEIPTFRWQRWLEVGIRKTIDRGYKCAMQPLTLVNLERGGAKAGNYSRGRKKRKHGAAYFDRFM